jgi:hypothetical protein
MTTLGIFMLYFLEIIHLLWKSKRYYHQYFITLDKGKSQLPDVTIQEMYSLLATVQMVHNQNDMLKATGAEKKEIGRLFMGRRNETEPFTY